MADPLEIVSPVIPADASWVSTIDRFWSVLDQHFQFRRDTCCGFYVHISFASGSYSLAQLRSMAKAVVFWEPATSRCAPLSRQDRVQDFCKSNVKKPVPVAVELDKYGPLRGLYHAYNYIDSANRDDIVGYVCPNKYRAWNFNPSRTGKPGSIEFRGPPGVVTAKKAKLWIAFAMAFLDVALQFNPEALAAHVQAAIHLCEVYHPDFQGTASCLRQATWSICTTGS
jgi:Putative amidoligase enzyme